MGIAKYVVEILYTVVKKLIEVSYRIIYFWLKYILPILLSISFFFFFITNGIAIGLESGIIIMFVLITSAIGLYLINGKTVFVKILSKMKGMFFFLDKDDKKKDDDKNENNNNNNNNNN